jgi:asparagine synthase (glutamine-hydrolysing)
MCGIAGILGKPEKTRETIDKMVDVITHRGPDDRGVLVENDFAFGMRRLSIIDLGGGHQPISNEDGTVTVVFNGEIYNHRELRPELISLGHSFKTDSDTEGLVHLYEQYGPDMLRKLRGMFGFCIFDKKKNQLFIARDFFGIKPIYYRVEQVVEKEKGRTGEKDGAIKFKYKKGNEPEPKVTQKIVSFGSEIKSLLEDKKYKPSVNDAAVFNYLAYQYNPLEQTMFEGIFKLLPGHYMTVDLHDGSFKIEPYWHYHFNNKNVWPTTDVDSKNIVVKKGEKKGSINSSSEETDTIYYQSENEINLAKEVRRVVEDSVAHHLIADVPVGSFLSGGVDSGIIVTTVQNLRKKAKADSVSTFTIGFDHVSEHSEARQVSDSVGSNHTEIVVDFDEYFRELPKIAWHFDEPVADPSAVALYFLAREARKKVKVVLSGEGADELFGGYNIYREHFETSFV